MQETPQKLTCPDCRERHPSAEGRGGRKVVVCPAHGRREPLEDFDVAAEVVTSLNLAPAAAC